MANREPRLEDSRKEIDFKDYEEGGLLNAISGKITPEEREEIDEETKNPENSSQTTGDWWFIEIWYENRDIFKSFVEHIVFTFLPLIFLFFVEWLIKNSNLSNDKKEILEFIDFCCIAVFLVIFAVNFLIKVLIFMFSGRKENG